MNNTSKTTPSGTQQPTIAKYVQTIRTGIRSQSLTRHCIGFVLRGTKYIYYGDVRHAVTRGKVFYLDIGTHYIEDIPDNGRSYEEVILFLQLTATSQHPQQLESYLPAHHHERSQLS